MSSKVGRHARRIAAVALSVAAILSAGSAPAHTHLAPARCAQPAQLTAHGAQGPQTYYSSYFTRGTMPSGTTVRLSDGDLWTCSNGQVNVH